MSSIALWVKIISHKIDMIFKETLSLINSAAIDTRRSSKINYNAPPIFWGVKQGNRLLGGYSTMKIKCAQIFMTINSPKNSTQETFKILYKTILQEFGFVIRSRYSNQKSCTISFQIMSCLEIEKLGLTKHNSLNIIAEIFHLNKIAHDSITMDLYR